MKYSLTLLLLILAAITEPEAQTLTVTNQPAVTNGSSNYTVIARGANESKAVLGWNFLNNALASHGTGQWPYGGAYQGVIPSFGGNYMHQDSLLWAAAAMFAAGQVAGQNGVLVDPHVKFLAWLAATHSPAPSGGASAQIWSYGFNSVNVRPTAGWSSNSTS